MANHSRLYHGEFGHGSLIVNYSVLHVSTGEFEKFSLEFPPFYTVPIRWFQLSFFFFAHLSFPFLKCCAPCQRLWFVVTPAWATLPGVCVTLIIVHHSWPTPYTLSNIYLCTLFLPTNNYTRTKSATGTRLEQERIATWTRDHAGTIKKGGNARVWDKTLLYPWLHAGKGTPFVCMWVFFYLWRTVRPNRIALDVSFDSVQFLIAKSFWGP